MPRVAQAIAVALLLTGSIAAGCAASEEPCSPCRGLPVTPAPAQAELVVGDTASVAVTGAAADARITWQSTRAEIVRIDTILRDGRQAVLRGITVGNAGLLYTVTSGSQVISGSIPVQVTVRP